MSLTRQNVRDIDGFPVRGLAVTYRDRARLDRHTHPWAQLVYAATGTMRVATPTAAWLVPPSLRSLLPRRRQPRTLTMVLRSHSRGGLAA